MSSSLSTVPLTVEDREQLNYIYSKRLNLFIAVYIVLIPFALLCSLRIDRKPRGSDKVIRWNKRESGDGLVDRQGMILINALFLETPLILVGYRIFRRRVYSFKQDVRGGVKECVYYEVIRKQHFETTGQYFLSFNDPAYMHHEVTPETYNLFNTGDTACVFRAPRSRYVFNAKGSFSLM